MYAAFAILAALHEEGRQGRTMEVSLWETALAFVSYHLIGTIETGSVPAPQGTGFPSIAPYQVFPTADGGMMITAANDGLFRRLVGAIGLPEAAEDPRSRPTRTAWRTAAARRSCRSGCRERPRAAGGAGRGGSTRGAGARPREVAADPQTEAIGILERLELLHQAGGPAFSADGERRATPVASARAGRAHGRGARRGGFHGPGDRRPRPPRSR